LGEFDPASGWTANYKALEWELAAEAAVDLLEILRRGSKPRPFKGDGFNL